MAALLRDFGEPAVLRKYEQRLRSAFGILERRVEKLPPEEQSRILAAFTDHLLQGIDTAKREAQRAAHVKSGRA
jgi:hypothetical protein